MSWLEGLAHRVRRLIHPNAFRRELDEEIQFHLELDAMQLHDSFRAVRRFGNRAYYKEETRRMTWLGTADALFQDLSYAWRSVKRSPGFTVLVVLTLALGLGATSALFSFIDRLYLRAPSGIVDAATLRRVWTKHFRTFDGVPISTRFTSYRRFRAIAGVSADTLSVAAYSADNVLRQGSGRGAPRIRAVYATANYFDVLGIRPALGRFFAADEGRPGFPTQVVVVSQQFWKQRLHSDTSAVGERLLIDRKTYTIVGVAPDAFTGVELQAVDAWLPMSTFPGPSWLKSPWWEADHMQWFMLVMRVSGRFEERAFEQRATSLLRATNRVETTMVRDSLTELHVGPIVEARGPGRSDQELQISTRLAAVAGVVLLIACANVINLLLARAVSRRRETAVRLALGISRSRLLRLLVLETVLLALIAATGAFLVAWWGGALLRALLLPDIEWVESAISWRVAAFTVVIALSAGAIAGLIPALQASRDRLGNALKISARDGWTDRSRLRAGLLVMQTALSVMLLAGAGLFVRSLINVRALDIGYDSGGLLFGQASFEDGLAPPNPVIEAEMRDVAALLIGQPGIGTVARAAIQPMQGMSVVDFYFDNDSSASLGTRAPWVSAVSPRFFEATGIRILRGTTFTGGDDQNARAEAIVNEATAALLWPGAEPLGACMRFQRLGECYTVVGVVENVHGMRVIEADAWAQYYLPLGHMPIGDWVGYTLVVRATQQGTQMAASTMRNILTRAFPTADVNVRTMSDSLEPEYRPWRLGATLFTTFGVLALLVATVGIYSAVSYTVSQRAHEFGVRVALGARMTDVLRHVIGTGVRTVAIGIVIGVALSLAAGRLVASLLFNVKPNDPIVLLGVSFALTCVAALAALTPAWRAARVDPVTVLKTE